MDHKTIIPDDASDFVLLSDHVESALEEIRYYTTYNFVGDRIAGYEQPVAIMTKEAALALKGVSDEMQSRGLKLKIFDAYRPATAVRHFMAWGQDDDDRRMKQYFYPDIEKRDLFRLGYIAARSSHSRGSTVDLTLVDMGSDREIDMGSPFDFFGKRSHPDYTGVTAQQHENRMMLRDVMLRHGFEPLDCEWWHFTLKDEPFPDTYFEFPVNPALLKR
ncbi:MAG: M15 family metallopeptidase [Clostridia bacterium]|nr:M15 family metallopeptidase [Clostridia bacterium]